KLLFRLPSHWKHVSNLLSPPRVTPVRRVLWFDWQFQRGECQGQACRVGVRLRDPWHPHRSSRRGWGSLSIPALGGPCLSSRDCTYLSKSSQLRSCSDTTVGSTGHSILNAGSSKRTPRAAAGV